MMWIAAAVVLVTDMQFDIGVLVSFFFFVFQLLSLISYVFRNLSHVYLPLLLPSHI